SPMAATESTSTEPPAPTLESAAEPGNSDGVDVAQTDLSLTVAGLEETQSAIAATSIPAETPVVPQPIEPVVTTQLPELINGIRPGMDEDSGQAATIHDASFASISPPAEPLRAEPVPSSKPPKPGQRWTDSLGLPFAPVKGLPVLVCVWETRKRDLEAFARATGTTWEESNDGSGPNHPAVNVSFLDATLFCEWLTTIEESTGKLTAGQRYRLPTDEEWSAAAGVVGEKGMSPRERDDQADQSYPWGTSWPPPPTAGNYDGLNPSPAGAADSPPGDLYPQTAPVGMFEPNQFGLFDMGGNVAEMVSDLIAPDLGLHATRGGSYRDKDPSVLRVRYRGVGEDTRGRKPQIGFRVVLDPRVKR
ncbi:MAG: SUMF1/EgtB/PvdO family nonheme iron enzyme, partial [Chthoniobacteraceae bacterium]